MINRISTAQTLWKVANLSINPQNIETNKQKNIPVFNRNTCSTRRQIWKPMFNYQNIFTRKIVYFYRSEEAFIDFNKDYYDILGVEQQADILAIKQRFYHLAKEYHPDRNQGNDSKFKEINEAYNVLSQPHLRKQYDANRDRDIQDQDETSLGSQARTTRDLNYAPYSQMSKADWAIYRSGRMKINTTDYTNYEKTFNNETNMDLNMKEMQQWDRAFRKLTPEQVQEEIDFRNKLDKKVYEDVMAYRRAKQDHLDRKIGELGDKIEKILGRRVRGVFDNLAKK